MGGQAPGVGRVDLGDLRRLTPIDSYFGYGRGTPIDRYYIEAFLHRHAGDVAGRVLEVKEALYTREIGAGRVTRSDVLDVDPENGSATVVADLARPEQLPSAAYDCMICTQTLQFIPDPAAAVRGIAHTLRPGGVALATVPGITPSDHHNRRRTGEYWRFTTMAMRHLLAQAFPPERTEVVSFGNVLAAAAFLHGLAVEDLEATELEACDPNYEVIVAARCVKEGDAP